MKKIIMMLCIVMMSVAAFADEAASCAFKANPNAYVVANVHLKNPGNEYMGATFTIDVKSYGETSGSVLVHITYNTDKGQQTITQVVSFSGGKGSGSVTGRQAKGWDFSVSVENAVCR